MLLVAVTFQSPNSSVQINNFIHQHIQGIESITCCQITIFQPFFLDSIFFASSGRASLQSFPHDPLLENLEKPSLG